MILRIRVLGPEAQVMRRALILALGTAILCTSGLVMGGLAQPPDPRQGPGPGGRPDHAASPAG
jgi:hypothetical protein